MKTRADWRAAYAYALWALAPLLAASLIAVTGSNVAVFHLVQSASRWVPAPFFAPFWESATYAGDGLAILALASLLLWQRPRAVLAGLLAAIPGGLLTRGIHMLVPVDRPPHVLAPGDLTILGPALQHGSFPSGHAIGAGILAGVVYLAYRQRVVRGIAIGVALLIAVSRSAVGVHWPIDALVGIVAGWLCAWIGWQMVGGTMRDPEPETRSIICIIVAGCGIALIFNPMGLPAATPFRYALALVSVLLATVSLARAIVDWHAKRASTGHVT